LLDLAVNRHHRFPMVVDVAHQCLHLGGGEAEPQRDGGRVPPSFRIVQDVEDGDAGARQLRSPAPVDDRDGSHEAPRMAVGQYTPPNWTPVAEAIPGRAHGSTSTDFVLQPSRRTRPPKRSRNTLWASSPMSLPRSSRPVRPTRLSDPARASAPRSPTSLYGSD